MSSATLTILMFYPRMNWKGFEEIWYSEFKQIFSFSAQDCLCL
jgi:hypothetical protein